MIRRAESLRGPAQDPKLRHQIQQERRNESGYSLMPPLLVEECLTVVRNGEQLEVLREAEALAL
jgi:hypothetical protein